MDSKYPIQFSLGQFVILFGVMVVLLGLSFFFGARFGDNIFPEHYAMQLQNNEPYQALQPQGQINFGAPSQVNRLVNSREEEPQAIEQGGMILEENEPEAIPHFQVGATGALEADPSFSPPEPSAAPSETWQAHQAREPQKFPTTFVPAAADKHTVVRFKSSGYSKFSVEVSEYFDELLAAQRIRNLKEHGYEAYLHIENATSRAPTFVVRVGAFSDRSDAEKFATQMSNQEKLELRVVQLN